MTEQEELIEDIRERLGEMRKGALPFNLLAFATTIGQRNSMTQNEIIRLVMQEADALGVNYLSSGRGRAEREGLGKQTRDRPSFRRKAGTAN